MASKSYKLRAWNIARSLGYAAFIPNLHDLIYAAETEIQVDNILTRCRHMAH